VRDDEYIAIIAPREIVLRCMGPPGMRLKPHIPTAMQNQSASPHISFYANLEVAFDG
jgi:hypothetical protein